MSDRTRAKLERKRRQAFLEDYYGLAIQIALYVLAFFAVLHRFNFLHSHILYGINRGFAWTFAMFSGIGMIIWLPMMAFAGSMRNTMRSMSTEDLAVERQSVIMGALYPGRVYAAGHDLAVLLRALHRAHVRNSSHPARGVVRLYRRAVGGYG